MCVTFSSDKSSAHHRASLSTTKFSFIINNHEWWQNFNVSAAFARKPFTVKIKLCRLCAENSDNHGTEGRERYNGGG